MREEAQENILAFLESLKWVGYGIAESNSHPSQITYVQASTVSAYAKSSVSTNQARINSTERLFPLSHFGPQKTFSAAG